MQNGVTGARGRVVMLVENLPVPLDRRTWQEARALHEDGWDVTVIGPRGQGTAARLRDRIDGIEVLRYPQRAASGLAGYLAEYAPSLAFTSGLLLLTLKRGRIAVLHACNPPDFFWPLGLLLRATGTSFVFDQHDANPELSLTKFGSAGLKGRLLFRLTKAMEWASYRSAALVIAPNDSYAHIARRRGQVDDERLVLVRNAPDLERYRASAAGVEPTGRQVGYVGVMGTQDGINILVDAWRLVVDEADLRDAVLHLVGDGEARPALERQVDQLGLRRSVKFHGYLPPEQFVPILAACQFTVSPDPPTPFNDVSTMVKVLDSLVIGRPVVAFDLQETRLLGGEAVRIVSEPTAKALALEIQKLLRDRGMVARYAAAARARPEQLGVSWEKSSEALVSGYARLAGGSRRGGR